MRSSITQLTTVAQREGIAGTVSKAYPNYALANTSATTLYGAANAQRLADIRGMVDPEGVMELAGGFVL